MVNLQPVELAFLIGFGVLCVLLAFLVLNLGD